MTINHIAIWTKDIEKLKDFYTKFFDCTASNKYENKNTNFTSYFLEFSKGTKLELINIPQLIERSNNTIGLAHFAVSVGSKDDVDKLTYKLKNEGFKIESEPRNTGDGYYESVIIDPEGNKIEITI